MAAKKSPVAKAPERPTTRTTLKIDAEVYRRLLIFSVMENRAAGEIVSDLLSTHLKGWAMPARVTARSTDHDRVVPAPELNRDAPAVPLGMTG